MKKIIHKELEELNSVLAKIPKRTLYTPKSDYYAKMQDNVLSRLKQEAPYVKKGSMDIKRWIIGIAASLAIIFGAVLAINTEKETAYVQIANTDIEEYLSLYVDELYETDLAIYLGENDFETPLDTKEIEEYIKYDIDDISEEDLRQF